jgi:hypothetical protein
VNFPTSAPRAQPSPVPARDREISPLVITCAADDFTAPASALAYA